MNISENARNKLSLLLPEGATGFSVTGFVGTCRGSTPVINPAQKAQVGQETIRCEGLTFFVDPETVADFCDCTIDYDPSFFGKGLTATWPHRAGCACNS